MTQLSPVYPLGSTLDERGRLQIGGCDVIELAREFGTPAYVVAEDDLRARARAFRAAFPDDAELVFATKAFPATAVLRLFAEEGLGCDVASGGELAVALKAGVPRERIHLHGNAKSEREIAEALDAGIGDVVIDNLDDVDKLERLTRDRVSVLIRVTPDVAGDTHRAISTGQADSKFGLGLSETEQLIGRLRGSDRLELVGLHLHIGSQILTLDPFVRAIEAVAPLMGDLPEINVGGGLGVPYTAADAARAPSIEEYAAAKVDAVREHLGDRRIVDEPGRALVALGCVTLYSVESVKRNVSTWVSVDGGMSDNLRPMLYGSRYEADVASRFGGGTRCRLVGKHCESGDELISDADLADPRPGDVVVTPATGAYTFALANNYNGQPRAPVIFCRDGDARVVVRRETYDDLLARDTE